MTTEHLTKRQREILERLEQGLSAKEIATDIGVSRNAVYQHIERLRQRGTLPETYTPSGQPPRTMPAPSLELGSAVPSPGFPGALPGAGSTAPSALDAVRRPAQGKGPSDREYAELVERAIAEHDVAALAYELGRLDATSEHELVTSMIESALSRLGALPPSDTPASA